jgi:hypothetical protein
MATTISPADEAESYTTYEAIAAALQRYIDAARSGSGSDMRRAFAENARVQGTYGGKPVDWSLSEFCDLIDKNGPAAGLVARSVAIDHQGNAAMARLEAQNWRGTRYTDFFLLVRHDGPWRISNKIFFAHARA